MKIICPSCKFSTEVDSSRIPANGTKAKCPKCKEAFFVTAAEQSPGNDDSVVICPKCGLEQNPTENCSRCGVIYEKYRAAEERRRIADLAAIERPEPIDGHLPDADLIGTGTFRFGYGRGEIMALAGEGYFAKDDLPWAMRIAGILPGPTEWRRFLEELALWLGAIFLATSVGFFIAYNWNELGYFIRFGMVETLLALSVLASLRLGLERMSGKAALLVATVLVGVLLALVGQTYQTGADPWELFATWALFVLPWVVVSCFSPLWLFWLALVDLAIGLYFNAFGGVFGILFGKETLWWTLAGVNTAALVAWELAASRGVPWLQERWAPRIVATAATGFVTFLAVWGIVDRNLSGIVEFFGYSAWLACAYTVYRQRIHDLYILALGTLSIIVIIAVFLSHTMLRHGGDAGAFLLVGLVVLGLSVKVIPVVAIVENYETG